MSKQCLTPKKNNRQSDIIYGKTIIDEFEKNCFIFNKNIWPLIEKKLVIQKIEIDPNYMKEFDLIIMEE